VTLDDLRDLTIPSVSYHLDLYVGIQREEGLDTDSFWRTDFVFTPDGDPGSAEVFKSKGINHFYLPPAIWKGECHAGTPKPEYECDVLFVGGGGSVYHPDDWPYRAKLLDWLSETYGDRYKKFGYPEPTIRNGELNDLYASAKVVVGDSLCKNFTHENYWSDRLYETTGRGGFLIFPYIKGIEDEYELGEELITYTFDDWAELRAAIDFYIMNDTRRKQILAAGMARTKRDHTYEVRLKKMLSIVTS
jgi:hypothetical protein